MENLADLLGVTYGHYVHQLRDVERFDDWRLNELDALADAVLTAVELDPDEAKRQERPEVRSLILRHFRSSP
jgi:hypothetical protein